MLTSLDGWMDDQADPDVILELVFCNCKKIVLNNVSVFYCKFFVQIFANAKAKVAMKSQNHFLYMKCLDLLKSQCL